MTDNDPVTNDSVTAVMLHDLFESQGDLPSSEHLCTKVVILPTIHSILMHSNR